MFESRPETFGSLIERLGSMRDNLGKGGRRLAGFLADNPRAAALLSSTEVAERCGVHASSVVRLAQSLGLSGYRELQSLLQQGLAAPAGAEDVSLSGRIESSPDGKLLNIHLLSESGRSFNEDAEAAAVAYCNGDPSVTISAEFQVSHTLNPLTQAERIRSAAADSDGIILVAREHPAINSAVRNAVSKGVPVVCLTSDLPSSGRTAYVGVDQFASGSTAGWLSGRLLLRGAPGKTLFVCSVPFRCQLDREQGFRQVLRSEFPMLSIDEKVSSDESADVVYEAVRRYIGRNGPPAAIYNVSGANLGIGRALEAEGLSGSTVFIGHELNANSRMLLEKGIMDLSIGHEFDRELALAVECIKTARQGVRPAGRITQSSLHTRFNCSRP